MRSFLCQQTSTPANAIFFRDLFRDNLHFTFFSLVCIVHILLMNSTFFIPFFLNDDVFLEKNFETIQGYILSLWIDISLYKVIKLIESPLIFRITHICNTYSNTFSTIIYLICIYLNCF